MFLAIDVGNTQTTLGLFREDGSLARGWRMSTDASDTADMLHARLLSFFAKDGLALDDASEAGVASVVPALERAWKRCLTAHLGKAPLVVRASEGYGMEVAMPDPRQVGADRIANAIAARSTYGSPVIVVDFGTATNIDVVDQRGRYRGDGCRPCVHGLADGAGERVGIEVLLAPRHDVAAYVDALVIVAGTGPDGRDWLLVRAHHLMRPGNARAERSRHAEGRHERHAGHMPHRHRGAQRERGYSHATSPRSAVTRPTRCSQGSTSTPPCVRKRTGSCMRSSMGTMT